MNGTTTTEINSGILSYLQFDKNLFYWILGIIITIIITILITRHYYIRGNQYQINLKTKNQYRIIWKNACELTPEEVFGNDYYRYKDYYKPYYKSEIDKKIKDKIINNQNILLIGRPLSGKTRTMYENLIDLISYEVLIPNNDFLYSDIIFIPQKRGAKNKKIIILDNLQKIIRKDRIEEDTTFQNFLFNISTQNIQIIASCQSGIEFDMICRKIDINFLVNGNKENIFYMPEYEIKEAKQIAEKEFKLSTFPESFDGTIGSLVLELDTMIHRYKTLKTPQINILSAIKMLFITGVYDIEELFLIKWVSNLCKSESLFVNKENFLDSLKNLESNEFINIINNQKIMIKDVYLYKIIKTGYEDEYLNTDIFNFIIKQFKEDLEVLFLCSMRSYTIYTTIPNKIEFMSITTTADMYWDHLLFYNDKVSDKDKKLKSIKEIIKRKFGGEE